MMLLTSANRGAKGKEATNSVMKPNWITGMQRGERSVGELRQDVRLFNLSFLGFFHINICLSFALGLVLTETGL